MVDGETFAVVVKGGVVLVGFAAGVLMAQIHEILIEGGTIGPKSPLERLAMWIVVRAKCGSYLLGEFFHRQVFPNHIYSFDPQPEGCFRSYDSAVFLVREQRLVEKRRRHLKLFGQEMRGPFKSPLEFDQAMDELLRMEQAVRFAVRMLRRCEQIEEMRHLREQIVVHGEEPSIEHLFEFLLSEAHWDDPGDRGGDDRADQTNER